MNRPNQNVKASVYCRPFTFVLKEGKEIKSNRLDYSLMLLQTGRAEILGATKKDRFGLFLSK